MSSSPRHRSSEPPERRPVRRPVIDGRSRRTKLRIGLTAGAAMAVAAAVAPFAIGSNSGASAHPMSGGAPHKLVDRHVHATTHSAAPSARAHHRYRLACAESMSSAGTLWGKSVKPAVVSSPSSAPATLGVVVIPRKSGMITGIAFWKGTGNTGTHTGSLSSDGKQLASGHFTDETASGWQWLTFAKPVQVKAGQRLVASYRAPDGHFAYTPNAFAKGAVCNESLRAVRGVQSVSGVSGDNADRRVHADHHRFNSSRNTNYFVDVRFVPAGATPPTSKAPTSTATRPHPSAPPTHKSPAPPSKKPTATPTRKPTTAPTTAPLSGWPGASNTGVPAGTKLTPSGGITVTTDNTKIDAKDISGPVVIEAKNVTISRSKIHSGGEFDIEVKSGNVTITDTELYDASQYAIGFDNWKGYRLNIHGMGGDGVKFGNDVTLQDSYVHDFTPAPGAHADGGQAQNGASNLLIRHNSIDPTNGHNYGNAAVFIKNDLGGNSGGPIVVDDNLLGGGNYTLYAVPGNGGSQSGITVTNNQFKGDAQYGTVDVGIKIDKWSGNIMSTSKAPVSEQQ